MKHTLVTLGLILCASVAPLAAAPAAAGDAGLVVIESAHDVPTTADRFVAAVEAKGLSVFSRIDHAAGAASAGMELPPTVLVIFGSPKVGTALMQCDRTVGIDLPLKALIWQDADGIARLAYNDTAWLAGRHDLAACAPVLEKVDNALAAFAARATSANDTAKASMPGSS